MRQDTCRLRRAVTVLPYSQAWTTHLRLALMQVYSSRFLVGPDLGHRLAPTPAMRSSVGGLTGSASAEIGRELSHPLGHRGHGCKVRKTQQRLFYNI